MRWRDPALWRDLARECWKAYACVKKYLVSAEKIGTLQLPIVQNEI
jgi:hypothetical protein